MQKKSKKTGAATKDGSPSVGDCGPRKTEKRKGAHTGKKVDRRLGARLECNRSSPRLIIWRLDDKKISQGKKVQLEDRMDLISKRTSAASTERKIEEMRTLNGASLTSSKDRKEARRSN